MKYISSQDIQDLIPNQIDMGLAEAKGLAKNQTLTEEYFLAQSLYYHFLEMYLEKKLGLFEQEKKFPSTCRPVEESEKDIYQSLSNHRYFYIRNTLYVENLLKSEIGILFNHAKDEELTEEVENLIQSTLTKVITTQKNQEHFITNYGPASEPYFAPNDILVLGLRFAEEDDSLYRSEEEWMKDYMNRRAVITNMVESLPQYFSNQLGQDVQVIEYFSESVKKKSSDELKR